MGKHVEPSVSETAFSCPHCGALTTQTWSRLYANKYPDGRTPPMPTDDDIVRIQKGSDAKPEDKAKWVVNARRLMSGELFFHKMHGSVYPDAEMGNLNISACFNCGKLAVWLHDRLLYPATLANIEPNDDLEDGIKHDFNEARGILDASPRGAAALLRLALQKLCAQLGESGKNIDSDIASLVGKGLNPLIQKALDVVRVIGNEAVHPGTIDLRDDRDTAVQLFKLINSIADQMISHPKNVNALYEMLPEDKRAGIDARNKNAIDKANKEK